MALNQRIGSPPEMAMNSGLREADENLHSRRNMLLCALLVGACWAITYPVAEMGFIDDWSYAKTALDFAHTGRILYNGWGAPMLGWQVIWGALFIKLFGFSFTILRFSMLPVAIASACLFYRILVRFGIASRLAVFGALTLGLSPLFLPLAASFMTDMPGLFVVLLCLSMCQRAVAAKSDRAALLWLTSAALLNVAGGTVRQIAWLGALVMVPATAWLLRERRGMLPAGVASWVVSLIAILGLLYWLNRQPYLMSEAAYVSGPIRPTMFADLFLLLIRALLYLLLVLLPVLVAWLSRLPRLNFRARIRMSAILSALTAGYIVLGIHGKLEGHILPWIGHILAQQYFAEFRFNSAGIRVFLSLVVVAVGLVFAEQTLAIRRRSKSRSLEKMGCSWRDLAWLLGPFTLSYLCLLLPRSIHGYFFDRYLLAPMAVAIIILLKLYQQEVADHVPAVCWAALAVFTAYATATTRDWYAMDRARVAAADEIQQSGVPRTEVQAGFDYDGWTQIRDGGHINNEFIRLPKGAYNPNVHTQPVAPNCLQFGLFPSMPAVNPHYFVTSEPAACLAPSKYAPVAYRTWLPPFSRKIYIQKSPAHPT